MTVAIHPAIDNGVTNGSDNYSGVLVCACADRPVKVKVSGGVAHNHVCGCTKCWKPQGATFSLIAVAPHENIEVLQNGDKLTLVDPSAVIQRYACTACGVHMYGPVERDHPFKGLDFLHPERFETGGWPAPSFAAFVSSAIEGGVDPDEIPAIRQRLRAKGIEPYDCLSPALMDYIATWTARKSGVLRS